MQFFFEWLLFPFILSFKLTFKENIMALPAKIDPVKLRRYLREGKSQRQIANIFGVSDSAVSQRIKDLNLSVARATQMEHAHAIVLDTLDCVGQLHKLNMDSNYLLDLLMAWVRGEEHAVELLKSHQNLGAKFEDPKALALKVMQQIQNQLKLQIDILNSVANFEAVADFQREMIDLIGEMDLEMKKKFVSRLREKRAIRSAVRF
jgi:hypothetical protein